MKVLVISPHPDDETLGAGGTILKHIDKGSEVYWCYFTLYFPNSSEEYKKERKKMVEDITHTYSFKDKFFLGFSSGELDKVGIRVLIEKLSDIIQRVKPQIIYSTGYTDVNSDHDYVYRTLMIAAKPSYAPFVKRVLLYEVPSSTNWSFPEINKAFLPNVFVDVSDYINRKIEIMRLFKKELKKYPHSRSEETIRALAKYRGSSVNLEYAEAFMLVREIKK